MKLNENYQIIFTWHSLGAAVAANMLIMSSMKGYINKEKNLPILITFGQTRTGNKKFVEKLNDYAEIIIRNINDNDLVTEVPLYNSDKDDTYIHSGGELKISESVMDINSAMTVYIDTEFKDVQKMKYFALLGNAAKNQSKHTFYYGFQVPVLR